MTAEPSRQGAPWPLPLRLPNPPSPLVGRAALARRLASLLERGPVAVVAGPGGMGKTALALQVLHASFAERVERTVFVALREGEAGEAPGLVALRALVRACGVEGVDWPELLHQAEAQAAMALDLAERNGLWVLLDDLHRAPAAEALELLLRLGRYARKSRWLVTTREPPAAPELSAQTLHVGALSTKELQQLARMLDPGAPTRLHLSRAKQAGGSPWALRRLAASRGAAQGPGLGALGDEPRAWLGALRRAQVPIPPALLGALWSPPLVDALRERGVLEATALGLRVHEAASDELAREPPAPGEGDACRRLGAALLGADDDALVAAGILLLLRGGALPEARAALERQGERLLGAGYAPALWSALPVDASFARLRLRCAVELGDPQALGSIALPEGAPAEARLLAAKALMQRGEPLAAAAAAREVLGEVTDPRLAFEAGFAEAQGLANGGELPRAEALLSGLSPVDAGQGALRDGLRAGVLGLLGRPDEALSLSRAAVPVVPAIAWPLRGRVALSLARSLYSAGQLDEARAVIDEAIEQGNPTSARLDVGRSLRFLRACVAIDGGDLARGRDELSRLEPYLGRASLLGPHAEAAWAHLHLAEGDLEAFEARRARLAASDPRGQLADELRMLDLRALSLRRDGSPPGPALPPTSIFSGMAAILWSQLALRSGQLDPAEASLPAELSRRHIELRLEAQLHEALRLLLAGDGRGALAVLGLVAADCEATGWRLRLADALERSAEAALLLGDAAELTRATDRLAAAAEASWSHRPAAAFFAALRPPIDRAQLERLAAGGAVAARCRALLGGPAPADRLERLLVGALEAQAGLARPLRPRSGPWQPGWGLDPARRAAWRPDGTWVSLDEHPVQWALLAELARSGGEATKEHLVLAVWGERIYHPLRHDNRLQATVRKLRVRLEDDPATPRRLLTTAEGYALGGVVRVVT